MQIYEGQRGQRGGMAQREEGQNVVVVVVMVGGE
jgi:hypothetical protein